MRNSRILLVDDLPEMLLVTRKALDTSGIQYDICEAPDGIEALKIMETWTPDLIITDWDMPRLNGPELIANIRKIEDLKDIPAIMITGLMVSPDNMKMAFESGASDFLKKPFDKIELLARVKSMLLVSKSINDSKAHNLIITEHSRFISSLMSAVPIPLVYYNIEGIIISCNESFLNAFELTTQQAIGAVVYQICPNPQQMKQQTDTMIHNNTKQIKFEASFDLPKKSNASFIITKTIYFNPCQQAEGIICIMSDISELKETHKVSMEEKKRELVSSAMRLIQMSEMNEKLLEDLNELNKHSDKQGKEVIKNLTNKYNFNSLDNTWKEFELRFERVYEEFYNRLIAVHPDITPSEKKLSALLRLSLSSKEIAALTFQDAKSVDMARYRLRKKLNLSQEDSLVDYLMKI